MTFALAVLRDNRGRIHMGKGNASRHSKNTVLGQLGRVENIEASIWIYEIIFFSLFM